MRNIIVIFILSSIFVLSCEKESELTNNNKSSNVVLLNKEATETNQAIYFDGDKTLFIDINYPYDLGFSVYGEAKYKSESEVKIVNGITVTTATCNGPGNDCGYIYDVSEHEGKIIGVYFVNAQ